MVMCILCLHLVYVYVVRLHIMYHKVTKVNTSHCCIILICTLCKQCLFESGIGKYSTHPRHKVWAFRRTPYFLDICCIFLYRTKINTVCIFSHDCPKLSTSQICVQLTDMTDDHKTRWHSVNSIPRSPAKQHAYNMYTCNTARSAVLAECNIRLVVETPPVSVRMGLKTSLSGSFECSRTSQQTQDGKSMLG